MNTASVHKQFNSSPILLSPVRTKLERIIFENIQQRLNEVEDLNDPWPSNTPTNWANKPAENFLKSVGARAKNVGSNIKLAKSAFYEVYYNIQWMPSQAQFLNKTALPGLSSKLEWYKDTIRFYANGSVKFMAGGIDPLTGKPNGSPRLLGWKFANNKIQLYAETNDVSSEKMGTLTNVGGKLVMTLDTKSVEKSTKTVMGIDEWTWKDTIRLALDAIGWIPFYGEIADLVNAVWYFVDFAESGNKWDMALGILSIIGAMPLIGSVISTSGKGIIAGLKAYKKVAESTDLMSTILGKIFKDMNPSANEIELILKGYHGVVTNFTKLKVVLHEKIGRADFDKVLQEVEQELKRGEDFIKSAKRNADVKKGHGPSIKPKGSEDSALDATTGIKYDPTTDTFKVADKSSKLSKQYGYTQQFLASLSSLTFERQAVKIVDAAEQIVDNTAGAVANATIGSGALKTAKEFLKKCLFYSISPKNQKFVILKLTQMFQQAIVNDPDRLLLIIRSSKKTDLDPLYKLLKTVDEYNINSATFQKTWNAYLKMLKETPAKRAEFVAYSKLSPEGKQQAMKRLFNSNQYKPVPSDNDGLSQILTTLRNSKETVEQYGAMAQRIARNAVVNNNPIWNQLLSDPITTLRAYKSVNAKDFLKNIWPGNMSGSNITTFLIKQLLHEGKELSFKLGITNEGDARGFISKLFAETWVEHFEFLKTMKDEAMKQLAPATTSDNPFIVPTTTAATAGDNTIVRR